MAAAGTACWIEAVALTPLPASALSTPAISLFMFLLFFPRSTSPQFEVEDMSSQEVPGGLSVIWM